MDVATISAAWSGLTASKDILKAIVEGKVAIDSTNNILEVLERLGSAQDALFQMREELFQLQSENRDLKAELEKVLNWNYEKAQYELVATDGSAVVWKYKGQPEHFACPVCMNSQRIGILQNRRSMNGKYDCPSCKAEFPVGVARSLAGDAWRR